MTTQRGALPRPFCLAFLARFTHNYFLHHKKFHGESWKIDEASSHGEFPHSHIVFHNVKCQSQEESRKKGLHKNLSSLFVTKSYTNF